MSMGLFPEQDEDAIYLSRKDYDDPLSAYSPFPFELDGHTWPTVEHYFHAMKFKDEAYRCKIRDAASPDAAKKLGRTRFKRIRNDWREVREVFMTRAVYTKSLTHPEVFDAIMATENARLVENSQYDYFWGCGRDRRGKNAYGRVLMGVRAKLKERGNAVE